MDVDRVARKKAILQSELSKTEQRLRDRTAVLSRLRRHHEELLNANGQLQYVLSEINSLLTTSSRVLIEIGVSLLLADSGTACGKISFATSSNH